MVGVSGDYFDVHSITFKYFIVIYIYIYACLYRIIKCVSICLLYIETQLK